MTEKGGITNQVQILMYNGKPLSRMNNPLHDLGVLWDPWTEGKYQPSVQLRTQCTRNEPPVPTRVYFKPISQDPCIIIPDVSCSKYIGGWSNKPWDEYDDITDTFSMFVKLVDETKKE